MRGLVIRNTGSWYQVFTDDGEMVTCKVKGNFRLKGIRSTNPVAVGDRVLLSERNDGVAYITEIEARRNYVIRRASNLSKQSHILAANIDQCFLVVTINYPETSTTFIDRFLASAEAYRIPSVLLFNKTDRYDEAEQQMLDYLISLYSHIGYRCLAVSARTGAGMPAVRELMKDSITLLAGNSGVGKSTLINTLLPHIHARTSEISDYHNKGVHTTTHSEMYPTNEGGYLIDIPGIKGFGTIDMEQAEVGHYFKEIFAYAAHCKFRGCTHTHEPACAVLAAVEQGAIAPSRYTSYLSILDDKDEGKYRPAY